MSAKYARIAFHDDMGTKWNGELVEKNWMMAKNIVVRMHGPIKVLR